MLAYDYPLLAAFWTMFIFFIWIVWLLILFKVIMDIFRSDDMGGFSKFIWLMAVIFMPYLGVFIYVIARGDKMSQHELERIQAQETQFRAYVQDAAASERTVADQIATLADLKDRGALTEEEFARQKAALLA